VFAASAVATSQPLATAAGLAALREGGNAVDAALASAITLTVVEPCSNGIGSDAFALVWDGERLHGLNASGRSPAALSPERFSGRQHMPFGGWDAVTVPGAVSAWVSLSERFGVLHFERLFADAVRHAREGFLPGPVTGAAWQSAVEHYRDFPAFLDTFAPGGNAPQVGSPVQLPDHAATLEEIADTRGESFYRGRLAQLMVEDSERHGGALALTDLAEHSCDWVDPISQALGDYRLHEIPPNGQGLMALVALGVIEHLNVAEFPPDSVGAVHAQIEATRVAYAEMERHLADPAFMTHPAETFLNPDYLRERAAAIDPDRANRRVTALGAAADTVYLTAADASGMMVSLIQSNYMGFGSGVVVPGTGISLQNRGCGFTLEPGHPNQVAGGKRPYHTIIPGFVTRDGQPLMSFGVMGGHMQAQGHLQMVLRICLWGQNPQAASDAPRWHLREDGVVCLEEGFPSDVAEGLRRKGHELQFDNPDHLFGGAQLIYRVPGGYCAASDHRKEGQAAGF
jgi:gamma-glutamyltranspeptidase/glutathione hydrolase